MSIIERILGKESNGESVEDVPMNGKERVTGRIIKLAENDGWGFISSKAIPFTRIFFHWSALNQDTLKFTELKRGMTVEFEPLEIEGKGYRAIRIKVMDDAIDDTDE